MSRYVWPRKRKNPDRPLQRAEWNARTDGIVTERDVAEARAARRSVQERRAAFAATARAPQGITDLWVPIGPSVVLAGQGDKSPRVAGRIRDLAVSPTGRRAYAASGNGGVWYTADSGNTWAPVGNWLPTPSDSFSTRVAQSALVCGCLLVNFGVIENVNLPLDDPSRFTDDPDRDVVYLGTGERIPRASGTPGQKNGGVGVLRLSSTITDAVTNPFGNHWTREAPELSGFGIFRLARDPDDPDTLIAATTAGVYTRSGPFVEDAEWERIDSGPLDFDADDGTYACDVVWMKGVANGLVVALYGAKQGVFCSDDGIAGPFRRIPLPGLKAGRIALAAHESSARVYALGGGPTLHRISFPDDDDPTVLRVGDVPELLFGKKKDGRNSSSHNIAVAVEPDESSRVYIGGSATDFNGSWNASLFRAGVALDTNLDLSFRFSAGNQDNPGNDNAYIGPGVHADVHRICLVKVGAETHGWIACDGGVFRSTAAGIAGTYTSCNVGLAVLEGGYLASHPTNDHFVVMGTQDNGVVQRVGDSVWMHTQEITGDGGGVAFHPTSPRYFLGQYTGASWYSGVESPLGTGALAPPVMRSHPKLESEKNEDTAASFYSGVDVMATAPAALTARIAIGTNRVWISEDWTPSGRVPNTWKTLPSGIDPRTRSPRDNGTDVLDNDFGKVIAPRWHPDGRLFVLYQRALILFTPPASAGSVRWSKTLLTKTESVCGEYANSDIDLPSSEYLPPLGSWSDLTLDDLTPGATSCYVACTGHATLDDNTVTESDRMDTLWWYDGAGKWWSTGLRNDDLSGSTGVTAPAFAVLVDPDNRDIVYVGTALGVWRGERDTSDAQPVWLWEPFDNGLPEAPVQDLSLFGPHNGVKLLRATIQARGVWEIDLSPAPTPVQRVFLRAHPNDARRQVPADLTNPTAAESDVWPWYICPDMRIVDSTDPAPWNGGEPTEADFLERYDPSGAPVTLNTGAPARFGDADVHLVSPLGGYAAVRFVFDEVYTTHVLVHNRYLTEIAASAVRAAVFITAVPPAVEQWAAFAVTPAHKAAIVDLLTAAAPAAWPFTTLRPVSSGVPRRNPVAPVDARTPRTVSFATDLAGFRRGHYALIAVVSSTTDPVSLASLDGATLQELVLNSHHVGVRVVRKG